MYTFAQDGSGAGTKISNGYLNGEIQGAILSIMSRRPDNLLRTIEDLRETTPGITLMLDSHAHASVYPETDKHGRIPDYSLYEMNISAFELQDDEKVKEFVDGILDFQNDLDLNILTAPSLAMQEFNDTNAQVCLKMHRDSIRYYQTNDVGSKKLYLSLVFSEQALNQVHSMAQMLDKLCLLDVDGFYIVVQRQKTDSAMWSSSDTLANLMYLVNTLHESEYEIAIGYSDLWGVLLSAVGADYIASGWHQTLRQYCQNFYRNTRGGPGSPLFVSEALMSTIYVNPDLRNIITGSSLGRQVVGEPYGTALLRNPGLAPWTLDAYAFQQWRAIKNVVSQFGPDIGDNLVKLEELINSSQTLATQIRAASITIDERHDDRHLGVWKSAIDKYRSGVL